VESIDLTWTRENRENRERGGWAQLLGWAETGLGVGGLVAALSALAAFPVANVLTLGYLLEASGRVARTRRLRAGFPGARRAARLTGLVLVGWFLYLPLRVAAGFWKDAQLVDSQGRALLVLSGVLAMLCAAAVTVLLVVLLKPGKGGIDLVELVTSLRIPHLFWLGLRGLVGGVLWLAIPVGMMWGATQIPGEEGRLARGLLGLAGGMMLTIVVMVLPFLQTEFARTGDAHAFARPGGVIRSIHRAPLACAFGLTILLVFSLPLYLGKIELPPRELGWLPAIFFLLLGWPARLALGWSWSRTERRDDARPRIWIWLGRALAFTVATGYALFVWLMQFLAWTGAEGMLEQHAFLLPTPFWIWE